MRTNLVPIAILVILAGNPALHAEEEKTGEKSAAPVVETAPEQIRPAPLMVASGDETTFLNFQFGADLFGGPPQGGVEFVGGVNASLLVKVMDLLYVGIRPALHYLYVEDSPYEVTWFHADIAFHLNILHDPVRLYVLGAGGYSAALDGDLYKGLAHGWSVLGGVGVSWQFEGPFGIFLEAGFRGGAASQDETVLDLDDNGNPQCTSRLECLSYKTKEITRDFDLTVFTINIGIIYAP
jgi:hypothetical protein